MGTAPTPIWVWLLLAALFLAGSVFAVVGPIVARYGPGLQGGRRLAVAVLGGPGERDGRTGTTSTGTEVALYVCLGLLYALSLPDVGGLGAFRRLDPGGALVAFTLGFAGVAWATSVLVLAHLDPDVTTDLPVLLSLAAEFGVFALALWVVAGTVTQRITETSALVGAVLFLLATVPLAVLSAAARRFDPAPGPGERTYAVGVTGLGLAAVGTAVLLGWVEILPAERPGLAAAGAALALGALAALGSVE